MPHFKKLIGDRIYLSPKTTDEEDVLKYTEWMNDFQITDYIGATAKLLTLDSEREWINNVAKNSGNYNFDIVDLNNDQLIGTIGLENIKQIERTAILGIFIGEESYRSNGFGAEAIKLLLEYGFKYLNLHSIKLDLLSAN